jgi:hypothetical protein
MMQTAAPCKPNAHWRGILASDREGQKTAELASRFSNQGSAADPTQLIAQMMASGGGDGCAQQ